MGFQRTIPHQIDVSRSKYVYMRAVRRSYGHSKHKNAIWRAQDAVKREHEGANRGDGVFSDRWTNGFEVKVEVQDNVGWYFLKYNCKNVLNTF